MSPWVYKLLWCIGLVMLAYGLLQSPVFWRRRLGVWLIWGTIGLAVWFCTESWAWVLLTLAAWFAIPLSQAVFMSRNLKFSKGRRLVKGRLDVDDMIDLGELTREMRECDFQMDGEYWLQPSPIEQGFRLFQRPGKNGEPPCHGAVAYVRQGALSLSYVIFITEGQNGELWMTWDYPMAYGLKMPPQFKIYRCLNAANIPGLYAQHLEFLKLNEVGTDAVRDKMERSSQALFDEMFGETLRYNLTIGLLRPALADTGETSGKREQGNDVAYSWRGTFFISWQVLRELIRG